MQFYKVFSSGNRFSHCSDFRSTVEYRTVQCGWNSHLNCFANVLLCLRCDIFTVERHRYMHHINLIKPFSNVILVQCNCSSRTWKLAPFTERTGYGVSERTSEWVWQQGNESKRDIERHDKTRWTLSFMQCINLMMLHVCLWQIDKIIPATDCNSNVATVTPTPTPTPAEATPTTQISSSVSKEHIITQTNVSYLQRRILSGFWPNTL